MTDKLKLNDILGAVDLGAISVWDEFTDEQKKSVSFFLLNRYVSNVKTSNRDLAEHYVILVNELMNKNFYEIYKKPKLMWQLMCCCGHDSKKVYYHEWMGVKKAKNSSSKSVKFLSEIYPNEKMSDLELLATKLTKKDLKQMAKDRGWEDKKINDLKL
jgi:hypothetical protein